MPSSLGMEEKIESNYYSPDFDYKKVPKKRDDKHSFRRNKDPKKRQFEVSNHMQIRTMAPFNIRCNECGTYTNKGSKIQSNVDKMPGMMYLGKVAIWRFHIRCPTCRSVIVFRTDPENQDYEIVSGGTRSFRSAYVRARKEAADEEKNKEIEDNNPMKMLEDRTFASKKELETAELLEDLQDMRSKPMNTDVENLLVKRQMSATERQMILIARQEEEDEDEIRNMVKKQNFIDNGLMKKLEDDGGDDDTLKPNLVIRIGEEGASKKSSTGDKDAKTAIPGIKIGVKRKSTMPRLVMTGKNIKTTTMVKKKPPALGLCDYSSSDSE